MAISAKEVMALRQKTGAGMMDCKKALTDAEGDIDKAMNILREKGLARARKRDDKSADEGTVSSYLSDDKKLGVLLEVNCETDFVARTDDFKDFTAKLIEAIAAEKPSADGWPDLIVNGAKAGETLDSLAAKLGEKMEVKRFELYEAADGMVEVYIHGEGRLGVILAYNFEGGADKSVEIAHDLTMQIAASNPLAVTREEVPGEAIEQELEIYRQQARNEGKPENIIERIAEGKLNKYYSDVCLVDQPFVKEPKMTIRDFLNAQFKEFGAKVVPVKFARLAIGGN